MLNTFFSPWPSYSEEEAQAVKRVLLSNKVNYWTGNECREFEREFALFTDSKYAVALGNGTQALEIALNSIKIQKNDDVIVTPRSYIASASAVLMKGANPIFADVDLNSGNITAASIKDVLTPNTKAIIVVHLAGMPADMDLIMNLASERNIKVIEDCSQAHGARYKGKSVGSLGDLGTWSFCQDKIMTTGGEGGMVTTNSEELWESIWSYKDHGKSFDLVYKKDHPQGFRWLHNDIGTNMRMTEMQGIIGRIQIKKMHEWHLTRKSNAKMIDDIASQFDLFRLVKVPVNYDHAEYKHYIFINSDRLKNGWSRDRIIEEIISRGVPCYQGSCPEIYLEKVFENIKHQPLSRLNNARKLGESSLMFLVHPTLEIKEIKETCNAISTIAKLASF